MARPILYIKSGCPWCVDAIGFLKKHKVSFDVKDIRSDRQAGQRMREISGQGLTPTMEFGDFVCADFDTRELMSALNAQPKVRSQLGLDGAKG